MKIKIEMLIILVLSTVLSASTFDGQMILCVNGHNNM